MGKRGSSIVSRDIALAAYSQKRDAVEIIRLEVTVPQSVRDSRVILRVTTPGYFVERVSGKAVVRLVFRATDSHDEKLIILDARHLHLEQQKYPRDLFYAPFDEVFIDPTFMNEGQRELLRIISEARRELCKTIARSRAYPEMPLCEVIPDQAIASLALSEQMDDGEFFGTGCKEPTCTMYTMAKALSHIARNHEYAFGYSISADGARGILQFMNSRRIPTYSVVRKKYPEVGLTADYEQGTANIKNSIKAAICLFDMNLAELPEDAREAFKKDPVKWSVLGAAAHNAGAGKAIRLYGELRKHKTFSEVDWPRDTYFENAFLRAGVVPKETIGFLKKYELVYQAMSSFSRR